MNRRSWSLATSLLSLALIGSCALDAAPVRADERSVYAAIVRGEPELTRAKSLRRAGKYSIGFGVVGTVGAGAYMGVIGGLSNEEVPFAKTYLPFIFLATGTVVIPSALFGRARRLEKKAASSNGLSVRVSLIPGGINLSGRF